MIHVKAGDSEYLFVRRWYGIRWYDYKSYISTKKMIKGQARIVVSVHNKLGRRRWALKFKPGVTDNDKVRLVETLMQTLERYEP